MEKIASKIISIFVISESNLKQLAALEINEGMDSKTGLGKTWDCDITCKSFVLLAVSLKRARDYFQPLITIMKFCSKLATFLPTTDLKNIVLVSFSLIFKK